MAESAAVGLEVGFIVLKMLLNGKWASGIELTSQNLTSTPVNMKCYSHAAGGRLDSLFMSKQGYIPPSPENRVNRPVETI